MYGNSVGAPLTSVGGASLFCGHAQPAGDESTYQLMAGDFDDTEFPQSRVEMRRHVVMVVIEAAFGDAGRSGDPV